jgi:predicted phage-related endonuclease
MDKERPALFGGELEDAAVRPLPDWPGLDALRLDKGVLGERLSGIGGSDANIILSGDRERVLGLWHEKRGEQPAVDLSDNLAVMLGCWTEPFNRMWYEKLTGERVDRLDVCLACSTNSWRRCTLDGYIASTDTIFEAKHTNAFAKADEVLERYMPQLQHNMAVARTERAILSVIFGNHKYEMFEIASDWIYQIELLQAEVDFWDCVETGREPVPALLPAPPKPIGTREVCLDGSNAWAVAATDWLEHREAAKRHANAVSQIKELIEPDVARAFGHGVEARRSKAGAISIREHSK